jgi:hypothetical protein
MILLGIMLILMFIILIFIILLISSRLELIIRLYQPHIVSSGQTHPMSKFV